MKKVYRFILPILLLLSVEVKSQAYTYIPFADSIMSWKGYREICAMGSCWPGSLWSYHTAADTSINNNLYRQIISDNGYLVGCFREDANKKVYFIYAADSSSQEKVLYDFSLSIGDSVLRGDPAVFVKVVNVDTPAYKGIQRRTLHLTSYDNWIEGIGSTASPIGSWAYATLRSVECVAIQNSAIVYELSCQSLFVGIEESPDKHLTISPNPSSTSFTIHLSSPPTTQTYFNLYDALGRAVKREEIISETTTMQRNNLPIGIYFWQLQQGNKILDRGKVVME